MTWRVLGGTRPVPVGLPRVIVGSPLRVFPEAGHVYLEMECGREKTGLDTLGLRVKYY